MSIFFLFKIDLLIGALVGTNEPVFHTFVHFECTHTWASSVSLPFPFDNSKNNERKAV